MSVPSVGLLDPPRMKLEAPLEGCLCHYASHYGKESHPGSQRELSTPLNLDDHPTDICFSQSHRGKPRVLMRKGSTPEVDYPHNIHRCITEGDSPVMPSYPPRRHRDWQM